MHFGIINLLVNFVGEDRRIITFLSKTGDLPILFSSSRDASTTAGEVWGVGVISTRGMRWAGWRKCTASTRLTVEQASEMAAMEREEVLEARMVVGGAWASSCLNTLRFTSRSS